MHKDCSDIKPSITQLSTKITPAALGLTMIDGLDPQEQSHRLAEAAAILAHLSQTVRVSESVL